VEIMFDTASSAMAQIEAGKFKPLAVTTPARCAGKLRRSRCPRWPRRA
jgi:tripartite-type tricarboxylate transporter receptor subunit TctC